MANLSPYKGQLLEKPENPMYQLLPDLKGIRNKVKPILKQTESEKCDKIVPKHSNHLKYAIKSKSLDLFDRPSRKLHLTRFRSLSTMSSIPEDSCCSSWVQSVHKEDDMVVSHRSPVSIDNGYRPTYVAGKGATITNNSWQSVIIDLNISAPTESELVSTRAILETDQRVIQSESATTHGLVTTQGTTHKALVENVQCCGKCSPNVQLTSNSETYGSEPVAGNENKQSQLVANCSKLATNVTRNIKLEPKKINNYAQSKKQNETQNKCDNKVNDFEIKDVNEGIKNSKIIERELSDDNVKKLSKTTWKGLLKIFVCLIFFSFSVWKIFFVSTFNDFHLPVCATDNLTICNIKEDFLIHF
jgi:hypothetical protein